MENDYEAAFSKLAKDLWTGMSASYRAKFVEMMESQAKNEKGYEEPPSSSLSPIPMQKRQPPPISPSSADGADTSEKTRRVDGRDADDDDDDVVSISDSNAEWEVINHMPGSGGDDSSAHENGNGEGGDNFNSSGSEVNPGGGDQEEDAESSEDSDSETDTDSNSGGDEVEDDPKDMVEELKQPDPLEESDIENESDLDLDDNISVITISDTEDEQVQEEGPQPPTAMICFRCKTPKKHGTFKNLKKFQFHIKRHTFGENFSCPTCKRPFLSLNLCAAHEIRAHGTEINPACCSRTDPLIVAARRFLRQKKKEQKRGNDENNNKKITSGSSSSIEKTNNDPGSAKVVSEPDYDVYDQDDIFDGHVVPSTSFLTYRGPPVDHIVQCYEIQQNFGRAKGQNPDNVKIGQTAILLHEQGCIDNMLGQFTKRNIRSKRFQPVPAPVPQPKSSKESSQDNSKDVREATTEEPKRKRAKTARKLPLKMPPSSRRRNRPT